MTNENGENPPKTIDQTEAAKKLRDHLKCAESLATKRASLNNQPCMVSTLVDLNPIKFNYYLSMISPDKYNGNLILPMPCLW